MSSSQLSHNSSVSIRLRSRSARWDRSVPPLFRPILRAYLLGYAFTVGPRLLALVLYHALKLVRTRRKAVDGPAENKPEPLLLQSLLRTVRAGFEWQRFPTFCAALVGGSTLLEPALRKALTRILKGLAETTRTRLSRYLSSFIAAWFSLRLLQSKQSIPSTTTLTTAATPLASPKPDQTPRPQAGRTLDLTLFAATRALDVLVGELWSRRRNIRSPSASTTTKTLDHFASSLADPLIFAFSSSLIMWNWFYNPATLPRAYNKWIASAASVDQRLIVALQRVRDGVMRYGEDTGHAALLQDMCEEYRWPLQWGDPATSVPFPCEMVHMGVGPSCELHALSRFGRAWLWSMRTYLPLQLAVLLLRLRSLKTLKRDLVRAFLSASRSSAFLGTFITLFYYSICLARTRVGPHILGVDVKARQKIDGGICVGTGCFLCGWSVLLEPFSRRRELALFVAPRAVATMLPRKYDADKQWRETLVFSASTAVVFTCVMENKRRVRGVLGGLLRTVLAA
ncbi:hypothetical protein J7T55_006712 [Diaporthe amygdali]|uniref:uncharacterized protein n=1 Tax=Phomopsis amygdali TaxID=1214568 RepID=UPI0022FF413C|nr:uncharacterized protein J7T55_006712 [Diaporthe amygdali]KAJ0125366.1 hypothetical protein J7T55_006712 [Diaporthe amygdali]